MFFNKKKLAAGSALIALSAFVPNQHEALANTDTFTANAEVVDAITVSQAQELDFGKLAIVASGNFTLGADGVQIGTPAGVQALGGGEALGKIAIAGPTGTNLQLSVTGFSGSPINLTCTATGGGSICDTGTDKLALNKLLFADPADSKVATPAGAFALSTANEATTLNLAFATATLSFGGRIAVETADGTGVYNGTFVMAVTY